jgi:ADP-ribosyl-[dinitrogen reductase] hydrolase
MRYSGDVKNEGTRTSSSHPLRIDVASLPEGNGSIGMTLCPGRCDRLSLEEEWARDLEADLAVIASWQPSLVLTLIEEHEFALLGVPEFASAMRRAGLPWRHLPIRDGDVPDAAFERAWSTLGAEARRVLLDGGRVLLHCRAGLGRTGMIAARLLVELGTSHDAAIAAVRRARIGTIETGAQERHVRGCTVVR